MQWIADILWPYLKILALLMGGAFGLPIPEDIALVWAGILIHDEANIFAMALVCYVGILLGDIVIFRAGHFAGPSLLRKRWIRSRIGTERLQKLRENLDSRAFITVLIARHLFYLRTATFLVCGAVRMRFWRFFIADAVAALVTVPLMMGLGYLFAEHQDVLFIALNKAKLVLIGIGVAGLLALVIYRIRVRGRIMVVESIDLEEEGGEAEDPLEGHASSSEPKAEQTK